MQIEQVNTSDLMSAEHNTRTHSQEQVQQIAASIREFGFCNPVLIDSKNEIIAGHGRVMGAKLLGLAQVPCIRLSNLTDAQKRAYCIADNRIAMNGGWDQSKLEGELKHLESLEIDLSVLGFDEEELKHALGEEDEVKLKPLTILPPPVMTWVLIGIPTVSFGSINALVERISEVPDTVVEVTVNNG